jgi:hypothetical protein
MKIRHAMADDWEGVLQAEQQAWQHAPDVKLITQEQFNRWLRVFPEGLWVAASDDNSVIAGHIFSLRTRYDPYDARDNRSWDEMTGDGFASTHSPRGSCLYAVSVSADPGFPGSGRYLVNKALDQAEVLGVQCYAGACRVPKLKEYAEEFGKPIEQVVEEYMKLVIRRKRKDPTLSVFLRTRLRYVRFMTGYFKDENSGDCAALLAYQCKES